MDINLSYNAVFYTDGSCNPNPGGNYSFGIFGYYYNKETLGKKIQGLKAKINVTNLGLITPQLEQENYTLYKSAENVQPSKYIMVSKYLGNDGTNYKAELNAILHGLINIKEHIDLGFNIEKVLIKTDSNSCVLALSKMFKEDMNITTYKSYEILLEIQKIFNLFKEKNIIFEIEHVYGHSSSLGNVIVDRLAYFGWLGNNEKYSKTYEYVVENKDTFFDNLELPNYVNFKNIYFLNGHLEDKDLPYLILNYKTEDTVGDKIGDVCMGSIYTNKRCEILENVIEKHLEDGDDGVIFSIDIPNLKSTYSSLMYNFGNKDVFTKNNKPKYLTVLEEDKIVNTIRPSGLAKQLLSKFTFSADLVSMYKNNETGNNFKKYDITNIIFEETVKNNKKKYKILLNQQDTELIIKEDFLGINKLNINLVLGVDIPNRNYFKKLEDSTDIKIYLYLFNVTNNVYTYTVLTDIKDIDHEWIGIWENYFSNRIYL